MSTFYRPAAALLTFASALLIATGCGSGSGADTPGADRVDRTKLVVYSGREKKLVEPLYKAFEKDTGIELEVRYADSASTAAQLLEEGTRSPADVFYAQDAGAIGAVEPLLAELPADVISVVPAKYRDVEGRWTGVTGRIRTLVYNSDELDEKDLPKSVLELADPAWKGKIGIAPTNASFIGFVTGMRQELGDDRTRAFLTALADNDPQIYEKNGPIVDAVGRGEVRVGLVNHYYLYEALAEDPELPIANHFFGPGDIGNMVNTSAIGVLASSDHPDDAVMLVKYMLNEGQTFIVNDAPEREYPLNITTDIASNDRYNELPALAQIKAPEVNLSSLGSELEATVAMIRESGLGT